MKAVQFELWPECNVGCRFCYLNKDIRKTSDEIKIHNMEKVRIFLEKGDFKDYTIVAFIGGEFMQGQLNTPEIKHLFFHNLELIKNHIQKGNLDGAWMSAALTQPSTDLQEVLDLFKDVYVSTKTGGFWVVTSWDTKYRFNKYHKEETWKQHLLNIKNNYPSIKTNISVILTGDLIRRYNNGEFRFQYFIDTYGAQMFFKPPHLIQEYYKGKFHMESRIPGFFPTRKEFLKFLSIVSLEEECYIWDKICNIHFRADALIRADDRLQYREKETKYEIAGERILPCGHNHTYAGYIDSDECMLCDKLRMEG